MVTTRCVKCGKILRDPESIARGMGPKCAGFISNGRTVKVKVCRRSGSAYGLGCSRRSQAVLPIMEVAQKVEFTKGPVSVSREERRRLFEERKPFQCGLSLPDRKALMYIPTDNGDWKENNSERVISHEQLQSYLKRYHFI